MRFLGILTALVGLVAAACSGSEQASRPRRVATSRCGEPGEALVPQAVAAFARDVTPQPKRFLFIAGTDSGLPSAAQTELQRLGPAYIYPLDTALRRKQLHRLDSIGRIYGGVPTVLITLRGVRRLDEARASVRLGGRFIDGTREGPDLPTAVQFACDSLGWRVASVSRERQT